MNIPANVSDEERLRRAKSITTNDLTVTSIRT